MAKKRLEWSQRALADVQSITDYYAEVAGLTVSWGARETIEATADRLTEAPVTYRPGKRNTHEVPLPRFPYTLIYRVTDESIRIVRVMHQARDYFND